MEVFISAVRKMRKERRKKQQDGARRRGVGGRVWLNSRYGLARCPTPTIYGRRERAISACYTPIGIPNLARNNHPPLNGPLPLLDLQHIDRTSQHSTHPVFHNSPARRCEAR